MIEKSITTNIKRATKWSTITEVLSKLASPVSSMILARLVSPEAFGVVAIVVMVTTFAELFADAGFQKYLVQHEFKTEEQKYNSANVAFWTNLSVSVVLLILIFSLRNKLAALLGSPNSGLPIAVGSLSLLFIAFSSIQMALYRRSFDFKKLFTVRIFAILVPFAVTIPLALLGLSYWAMIIGTLSTHLVNAILLTVFSKWKPRLYYSFTILKEMFSFTFFTLIESITIWLTVWADIFILGRFFNEYYLGIYRTSSSMVNALMSLITASIVPVLFAALSRLQNDKSAFENVFLKVQKYVAMLAIPLGVGVFFFRELATTIILGDKWAEASLVIGMWALSSAFMIVYSQLNSEVFRAKGKPLLSTILQLSHLAFLIPICLIFARRGFEPLIYARNLIRLQMLITSLLIMRFAIKFPVGKIFKSTLPILASTAIMAGAAYGLLMVSKAVWWQFVAIFICIIVYGLVLCAFPSTRKTLLDFAKKGYNKLMQILKKSNKTPIADISVEEKEDEK